MAKRISAKVDEYEKDGQTKGKYIEIGVELQNENGPFILLNPSVNLAGVLMQQRVLNQKKGKQMGDMVMCSVFDNEQQSGQQQAPAQAGGAAYSSQAQQSPAQQPVSSGFDDDIPGW